MSHQPGQPHVDEVLSDLTAELSIEPSPAFGVRVRARVESAAVRSWGPSWGVWASAAAAAAAIGALIFIPRAVPDVGDVDPPATPQVVAASTTPVADVVKSAPVASVGLSRRRDMDARPQTDGERRLEVLTTQPAILRALWARSAAFARLEKETEPPPDAAGTPSRESVILSVEPVTVDPIIVSRIGGDRRGPGERQPEARRSTTEMSPRSAK